MEVNCENKGLIYHSHEYLVYYKAAISYGCYVFTSSIKRIMAGEKVASLSERQRDA